MIEITEFQKKMLGGLSFVNNAYISASEHNEALDLCEKGLAHAWRDMCRTVMWRITDKGREYLTSDAAKDKP